MRSRMQAKELISVLMRNATSQGRRLLKTIGRSVNLRPEQAIAMMLNKSIEDLKRMPESRRLSFVKKALRAKMIYFKPIPDKKTKVIPQKRRKKHGKNS
ncbi:MAG: hypothetical protein WC471_03610 [Candidatus Woesearchaeota archaeon]